MTRLAIKDMVCPRCVATVREVLTRCSLTPEQVDLGKATVAEDLTAGQLSILDDALREQGFALLRSDDDALVERVKNATLALARSDSGEPAKLSEALTAALQAPYARLSAIFSAHEGRTIENYFITQKIAHVAELLSYGELTVSEIAWRTGYSSVAHLSRQFKQVTGLTPTQYRQSPTRRKPITEI